MNIIKILLFSLLMSLNNYCAFVMTYARNFAKPLYSKKFAQGIAGASVVSYMYKNSDNIQKSIRNFKIATITVILGKLGLNIRRKTYHLKNTEMVKSMLTQYQEARAKELEALQKRQFEAKLKNGISNYNIKKGKSVIRRCGNFFVENINKIKKVIRK